MSTALTPPKHYDVYGIVLSSSMPIDELEESAAPSADCCFRVLPAGEQTSEADWQQVQKRDEHDPRDWMLSADLGDSFLLRFPGLADFQVSQDGELIEATPTPGLPDSTLRHLLLDQVLPFARSMVGDWVLHASAVAVEPGVAVAFAAPTGWGKSSLSAFMAKNGFPLLSDDGVLLREMEDGRTRCLAGYSGVRLWGDSASSVFGSDAAVAEYAHYSSKRRIALDANGVQVTRDACELRAIYMLSDPADSHELSISRLSPREAMVELVKFSFCLRVKCHPSLVKNFERFSNFALRFPCYRLTYPRSWSELPSVVDAIRTHVGSV